MAVNMTRVHYNFIADKIGPQVAWPSHLHSIADALESTNTRFDRDRFIERATTAWEKHNEINELHDEIPY